jgi:choice-of-anchor B domain-containing protein
MPKALPAVFRLLAATCSSFIMLSVTAPAVPRDYEGSLPGTGEAFTDQTGSPDGMSISAAGDTVFSFCNLRTFQFSPANGGSDCWGWEAPDGTEYAIMGVYDGVAFVDATNLQVITTVPGPTTGCGSIRWRDMVTYQNYCYCVSECSGANQGIMIMDMSFLPDSVHLAGTFVTANVTSHNMVADTSTGYIYAVNSNYTGVRIISVANPEAPVEIGTFPLPDCHDMYARNDTVWVAEGSNGTWSAWNLTNKNSPVMITRIMVPNAGYVHNIWPSGDGRHVITTEETGFKTVKYWNVEDYGNVQLVSNYLAPSNLAHNAHLRGDTAYISHYESGVAIVDYSNPAAPVELARYDTYGAGESAGFGGCWGAYPFTTSGKVYASNGDGRLFILSAQSVRTTDTAFGDSILAPPDSHVKIDVSFHNENPMTGINLPISWAGTFGMTLDSISTYGLRTAYFPQQSYTAFDAANSRAGFGMASGNEPPLPPGDGPVMSIYLKIPPGAVGPENLVQFTQFNALVPEVIMSCVQFEIHTEPALITLDESSCCQGLTGNVDQDAGDMVTLTDLTVLVNSLFVTFDPLPCPEAANINGDPSGEVSLTDLTALVNALFVTFDPPAACQ